MGRLLDRLVLASSAYEVRREEGGFVLVGRPERADEFSALVREAAEMAGDDCLVFPTSDGRLGYVQMFVMPLESGDDPPPS